MSRWASGLPPLFFVNAESPADRARWSLAHEIGHVIMHRNPSGDQEREADRFAAEFLLPAKEIAPYLKPVSLERVAALKPLWRVSMAALIKRAFGEAYYKKLFTQLNKVGYRLDEPNPLEHEEPTVIKDILEVHQKDLEYSDREMSSLVNLHLHEFRNRYFPNQPRLRLAD
jgi:Zn-dependent peptidase ImmA (M78 family)